MSELTKSNAISCVLKQRKEFHVNQRIYEENADSVGDSEKYRQWGKRIEYHRNSEQFCVMAQVWMSDAVRLLAEISAGTERNAKTRAAHILDNLGNLTKDFHHAENNRS